MENAYEYDAVSNAYAIVDMHKELLKLREENKELKEKLSKREKQMNENFKASKDIHNAWFGALLNGGLKVEK